VRFFPLSLSGPASWFASLPHDSIEGWEDLETKFHQYFDTGIMEKGITELVDVRQGNNKSALHYLQRFKEVRNQCYTLTLLEVELVSIVIRGLIPAIKVKIGFDCPNLATLARKLSSMEAQFRYAHFNKPQKVGSVGYDSNSGMFEEIVDDSDEEVESDEIASMDWVWKYFEYIPWAKNKSTEEK